MSAAPRLQASDAIAAYLEAGSVWKAGAKLGVSGQTVHAALQRVGHPIKYKWTDDEVEALREMVTSKPIGQIAETLGRSYAAVASKINDLSIGERFGNKGPRKIPRGQGYDKASIKRHIAQLETSGMAVTRYARQNGLMIEAFARACETHFPDWWADYRKSQTGLDEIACAYCGRPFYPSTAKHIYCTRKCQGQSRVDASYFGGKRRQTVGLEDGICQLCERRTDTGLSSHHVLGKENDADNEVLVALCRGCHQLVTMLGGRSWSSRQWESLISLAWMRKNGKLLAEAEGPVALDVEVDIDFRAVEGDEELGLAGAVVEVGVIEGEGQ